MAGRHPPQRGAKKVARREASGPGRPTFPRAEARQELHFREIHISGRIFNAHLPLR